MLDNSPDNNYRHIYRSSLSSSYTNIRVFVVWATSCFCAPAVTVSPKSSFGDHLRCRHLPQIHQGNESDKSRDCIREVYNEFQKKNRPLFNFEFSLLPHCLICIRCFHVVVVFTRSPRGFKTAQDRGFSCDSQPTNDEWKSYSKESGPL